MATTEAVWVQVTIPDDKIDEFLEVPSHSRLTPVSGVHCSHHAHSQHSPRLCAPSIGIDGCTWCAADDMAGLLGCTEEVLSGAADGTSVSP